MTSGDSRFERLEAVLGRLMLAGVIVSALCLSGGLAMFLAGTGPRAPSVLLALGLSVLMATPVLRVAVAVIESLREQDWFFLGTTLAVAVLLGVTLAHALAGL